MIRYVLEDKGRIMLESAKSSKKSLEQRVESLITYYATQETYGIQGCENKRLKNLQWAEGLSIVKVKIERVKE